MRKYWHTILAVLGLFAGTASPLFAQPQQAQPSLGEIARKAREEKKPSAKPVRLWTNDDLPTSPTAISIVGQPPAPPPEKQPAIAEKPESPEERAAALAKAEAELKEAQADLQRFEKESDLAKRELDLERQQFYSNPNYPSDVSGKARLDTLASDGEAKQREVQRARERVAELEKRIASLKRAPEAPKPPTASPPQP